MTVPTDKLANRRGLAVGKWKEADKEEEEEEEDDEKEEEEEEDNNHL